MDHSVISGTARTPFGKLGGVLASKTAVELGTIALEAAISRSGIDPVTITKVIFGHVLQGGTGQNAARQVGVAAGLELTTTAETVNRVCGSGLLALANADNLIRLQEHEAIAIGGMESMSQAPYFVRNARFGYRMGPGEFEDLVQVDGLFSNIDHRRMGDQADLVAHEQQMTRERADAWALRSHQRAIAAHDGGKLADELVPVLVQQKRDTISVTADEAPRRDTSAEALARLKPVFNPDGLVTAGNAPGLNDGASAAIITSERFAREHGLPVKAVVLAHADVAWDIPYLALTPAMAAEKALAKAGIPAGDVDLWEINEAFASVALISTDRLGIDPERVNVNGGAIAIGHPLAASGPRLVMTLIEELHRRGGGIGVAAMCSGGGQGDAIVLRVS